MTKMSEILQNFYRVVSGETETKISWAICQATFKINKTPMFKGSERNYVANTFTYNMLQSSLDIVRLDGRGADTFSVSPLGKWRNLQ